jgi:hypothetical protein
MTMESAIRCSPRTVALFDRHLSLKWDCQIDDSRRWRSLFLLPGIEKICGRCAEPCLSPSLVSFRPSYSYAISQTVIRDTLQIYDLFDNVVPFCRLFDIGSIMFLVVIAFAIGIVIWNVLEIFNRLVLSNCAVFRFPARGKSSSRVFCSRSRNTSNYGPQRNRTCTDLWAINNKPESSERLCLQYQGYFPPRRRSIEGQTTM